ncbi:MAG: MMPL family transporter [Actinomycetota bacterium]
MTALAALIVRRARWIVALAIVAVIGAGTAAGGIDDLLSTGGNHVPGSDSSRAIELLAERGEGSPNLLLLVTDPGGLGDAAAAVAADALAFVDDRPETRLVDSPWGAPDGGDVALQTGPLVSADGTSALIVATILGDDVAVQQRAASIAGELRAWETPPGVTLTVGGSGPARADLVEATDTGLVRAELIALPISLLILLFVFRTPVAAALPLVVAAVAVVGTLAVLRALVTVVEVSVFARSVATAIGLAMAVDMTLFLVSRYREVRDDAGSPTQAVERAVVAAGPAMVFSGITTAVSLAALLAFDTPLLRSFAYAGSVVVLLALVGGLVVLPATIVVLGDRVDRWPIRRPRLRPVTKGVWYRIARGVARHPVSIGAVTLLALITVAFPIARIEFGLNDDRVLSTDVESRQVLDTVRSRFPAVEGGSIAVVYTTPPEGDVERAAVEDHRNRLAALPGVARVDDGGHSLIVVPEVEPMSAEGRRLVEDIRQQPSPLAALVGGEAARLVDNTDHVLARLPFVAIAMALVSLALLAALFRSVLLPIKAIILNLLSLSAMFGSIVWVFQDGRFAGALDYTPTGLTDVTVPLLMLSVAFGLSMDYEVYLLSRIRDEYRAGHSTVEATARGLQRTGGVLSASAALMAVVFTSFAFTGLTHLKILGLGISLAVLVDAFVVRALLVPSAMAMAGDANWWPGGRRRTPPAGGETPRPPSIVAAPDSTVV